MKDKKLLRRQAEGLYLIMEGMQAQLNQVTYRKESGGNPNEPQTAAMNAVIGMLKYWIGEAERALKGELHF